MWCNISKGSKKDDVESMSLFGDVISNEIHESISKKKTTARFTYRLQFLHNDHSYAKRIDRAYKELNSAFAENLINYLIPLDDTETNSVDGSLSTAVVECNFASVNDVFVILEDIIGKRNRTLIRVPCCGASVNSVIDDVKSEKSCVLLIEQVELSSGEFIDNLFRLLNSNNKDDCQVAVIVCVSTDVTAFSSLCSISTLNRICAKTFQLPSSIIVFEKIIEEILFYEKQQFWTSGELTAAIRNRFFSCNHSVTEVKRILQFAMLQHCIKNPLHDENELSVFRKVLENYWRCLKFVSESIGLPRDTFGLYLTHESIQCGKQFWTKRQLESYEDITPESKVYNKWYDRQRVADPENIIEFCNSLSSFLTKELVDKLKKEVDNYNDSILKDKEEATNAQAKTEDVSPLKAKKMSLAEHKKMLDAQKVKKLNSWKSKAIVSLFACIENCLDTVLCNWKDYEMSEKFLVSYVDEMALLHGNPAHDAEAAMIQPLPDGNPAVSLAYQKLLTRPNFKYADLATWGPSFEKDLPKSMKNYADSAFFASLGQLEVMGIVRARPDKKDSRVNIIYHPTLYT